MALAFGVQQVRAQSENAQIQGTITDPSGEVVPGAKVTATKKSTGTVYTATTNRSGDYTLPALPPGHYVITFKKQGFSPKSVTADVTLMQALVINVKLAVGHVTQHVSVTGQAPLVQAGTSAIGTNIQGPQITNLPLNGRNIMNLALLSPGATGGVPDGVASGAGGNAETFRYGESGGASISVNGIREQANNYILDGLDDNGSLVNTIAIYPQDDAIREFRVQESIAPAQFGRGGGALVIMSTKSGTNQFHGSAFEFLRNDALDARPTFDATRPSFQRNQFGGALGGPIIHNKLFFFGDYNGWRQNLPFERSLDTVPTAAMRNGNFSELLNPAASGLSAPINIIDPTTGLPFPGNIIPSDRINQVGQNYLDAFPMPNYGNGQVENNYAVTNEVQREHFNDFDIRTDWDIDPTDNMFVRFSYGQDEFTTNSQFPNLPAGFATGQSFNHTRGVAIGETHIFNPNMVNELRIGWDRMFYGYTPPFDSIPICKNLGIPNCNTSPLLGGGALIGGTGSELSYTGDYGPYLVPQNTPQGNDTLTWIHGKHTFKFGADIIRREVNLYRPLAGKGFFYIGNGSNDVTGYDVSALLAGFVQTYNIGPNYGMVGTRSWEMGYFGQDDWRVTPRLTLNLGLRYDLYTWPSEVYNRQSNFNPGTDSIEIAGQNGNSRTFMNTNSTDFAPRGGFAYSLGSGGKTVIRGGFGMFYFLERGGINNQLAQNPPFSGESSYNFTNGYRIALSGAGPMGVGSSGNLNSLNATGALPLAFQNFSLTKPANVSVLATEPNNVVPRVREWNLQVERQLGRNTLLSVAYVGDASFHNMAYYNLNQQLYNQPNGSRLFPNLGSVTVQTTNSNSNYNSLQVQLRRRFAQGLQFQASYTYSHTLDWNTGTFDTGNYTDAFNQALDYGNSNIDFPQRFVFSSIYELPVGQGKRFGSSMPDALNALVGGWQLNGILTLRSGQPFSVTDNWGRADMVCSPQTFPGNTNQYFSTNCFVPSPTNATGAPLGPGTSGRNILFGPGYKTLDLSIFKNFTLFERLKLQYRADFFNITNTPQFATPVSYVYAGNFGQITNTLDNSQREIQMALRLTF